MDVSYLTESALLSYALVGLLGLIFGSFASVLTYRVPRQRSWVWEELDEEDTEGLTKKPFLKGLLSRSKCPECKETLGIKQLVPLLSWCLQGGKCAFCKTPISRMYPLIELASLVLFVLVFAQYGWSTPTLILILSIPFLIALFVIDLQFWILPNHLIAILLLLATWFHIDAAAIAFENDLVSIFVRVLIFASAGIFYAGMGWSIRAVFKKATGKEGLGLGDVKFFGLAGFWLGWWMSPVFLLLSCVIGVVFGGYWRYVLKSKVFPYGPALVMSLYLCLVYTQELQVLFF